MFDHPDANSRWKLSHRWHYHPVKRKDEDFSRLTELFEKALHAIFQADFSCQLTEVEKKIEVLFYQPEDLQLFIKQWLKNGGVSLICELDELRRTVPKELTSHKEARLLELPAMMIQVAVWNVVLNTFAKYQIGEYQGVTRFFAKEKRKKYLREREEMTLQYGGHPIYDRVAALVAHFFDLPAGEKRQNFYREKYVKERWEKCLRVIQAASHMRVNAG